jgi:hypothetical protein
MTDRSVQIGAVLSAQTSRFEAGMRKAGGAVKGFAARVEGMGRRMRAALRNTGIGNVAARLRGLGTSIAGFAGIYGVGQAIKQVRDFEDSLADLAIFGRKMAKDPGWIDRQRKAFYRISNETGVAKDQLAAFANRFVELTGNADMAMGSLESMAKAAVASKADMTDLAEVMNQLTGAMNIKGAKQLTQALEIMAKQAVMGSMSFRDIAAALPRVGGIAASMFGAQGLEGIKGVGGLLQMAVRVAGKRLAPTATARFLTNIAGKRAEVEKTLGVRLGEEGEGGRFKWKSLGEIARIVAVGYSQGTEQQRTAMKGIVGEQGLRLLTALGRAGTAGWEKKVGAGASGKALFGAAGAQGLLDKMYAERAATAGHKITKTMNKLTNEIHKKLLPVFQKLAEHMPAIAKGLGWVIENIETLLKIWAVWKASQFFSMLQAAPAQIARAGGATGAGGVLYGAGGAAGPAAAAGAAGAKTSGMALASVLKAGLVLYVGTEIISQLDRYFGGVGQRPREKGAWGMMGGIFRGGGPEEDFGVGRLAQQAGGKELGAAAYAQQIARKGIGRVGIGGPQGMDWIRNLGARRSAVQEAYVATQEEAARMKAEGKSAAEIAKALPELANLRQAMRMLDETMKRLKEGIPLEGANTPDGRAKQRQNAQAKR